jgi:hypothetical protein
MIMALPNSDFIPPYEPVVVYDEDTERTVAYIMSLREKNRELDKKTRHGVI